MNKIWRWLLFLAAITGLISNVAGLKATSLIFGRGPASGNGTTTTTTIAPALDDAAISSNASTTAIDDEYIQPNEEAGGAVTKPTLTGIPQIDYVWDPNLPHELNGYNLSTYPFLSLVPDPDDIDFKCDGLHDGFYASLKYSCQLYHHCIYGIRHDFLCANFTAFDQKTFICQFVSEVNCKASPKYFFRNDALYVALTTTSTTTTTIAPPITQPPQIYERPRPRRPLLRRRPQPADYYEEDYEDEYVDTRPARRRQPVRGRTRRPEYDDYGGQSQGRRYSDDTYADRRPNRNRDPVYDDADEDIEEPVRPRNRNNGKNRRVKGDPERKPNISEDKDNQRPSANDRRAQKPRRKPNNEKRVKPKPQRYEDEEDYAEYDDRSYSNGNRFQEPENDTPKVTPTGGGSSLFSKPRAPPRINRPVPVSDKKKFEYTPKAGKTTTSQPPVDEADYEEDYQEPAAPIQPVERAPLGQGRRPIPHKSVPSKPKQPDYLEDEEDIEEELAPVVSPRINQRPITSRNSQKRPSRIETRSNKPAEIYAEDESEEEPVAPPPTIRPRTNNLRPALLRNRVPPPQQKQEEGRASQRKPVLAADEEDEEEEIVKPTPSTPVSRPQSKRNNNLARPTSVAPIANADARSNRRPDQNSRPIPEISSNKFRNSFRLNLRDSFGSSTTSTTTAPPESVESLEDEEYEDEELDEPTAPESLPLQPQRPTVISNNQYVKDPKHRFASNSNKDIRYSNQPTNNPQQNSKESNNNSQESYESDEQSETSAEVTASPIREARPIVRVIKRPFLPSRGGNPYLPRGLKPLGPVEQDSRESSAEQTNPSSISGSRLTEFHPPLMSHDLIPDQEQPTTTEAARFDDLNPRAKLEEILSSDLDVTLNDALNPTLKPLSRSSPIGFSFKYNPSYYEQPIDRADRASLPKINPSRGSTSYYGSEHQQHPRSAPSAPANTGPSTDFYADYEY